MTAIVPVASPTSVDTAIELYNELLELPVVSRAVLLGNQLHLETSHRSISQLVKRNATQTLTLDSHTVLATSPLVFSSPEVQHASYSPNGTLSAIFRATGTGKERKSLIEIWETENGVKVEEIDVGNLHGEFYFDGTLVLALCSSQEANSTM